MTTHSPLYTVSEHSVYSLGASHCRCQKIDGLPCWWRHGDLGHVSDNVQLGYDDGFTKSNNTQAAKANARPGAAGETILERGELVRYRGVDFDGDRLQGIKAQSGLEA